MSQSGVDGLFPYWLIFAYFAIGSLLVQDWSDHRGKILFAVGMLAICTMVGFRYQVGGDWVPYLHIFERAQYQHLLDLGKYGDIGYQAVNWAAHELGFPFWSVNLFTSIIFCWGLARFSWTTPNPWTAITIAVPYLVIVVSMGYTRQAAAIGVIMCAIAHFQKHGSLPQIAVYIFLAALFHKTAVVCLPLFFFGARGSKALNLVLLSAFSVVLFQFFLADSIDTLKRNYIESEYSSSGTLVRILLSSIPATLFLTLRNRFNFRPEEDRIWRNFSYASLMMLILYTMSPSSTAVDRIGLYLLPLEIAILTSLPSVFRHSNLLKSAVLTFSFAVQFTWLNFGTHAELWLPYRTYLSEGR